MSFNDDEPIVEPPEDVLAFEAGNIQISIKNRSETPLEETELKVLVELTGLGDRAPVDLVMVVDVSRSTNQEDRIGGLKNAMQFLIKKLSPVDRLSVVTFSWGSRRLFPLRQITENSQEEIIKKVIALKASGLTNMAAGLKMALEVLNDRRLQDGRVGAIMLMSDGEQSLLFGDARRVDQLDKFPVYTFSLGKDSKPEVLQEIARKSNGGTFSDVPNQDHLSAAFSQCLSGLLIIVAQDLKLTITQVDEESKIKNVFAGNYPQTDNDNGSLTISFGELYDKEVRKVLVNLLLPKVDPPIAKNSDVLEVCYTYSIGNRKRMYEAPPVCVSVDRTRTAMDEVIPKVNVEENRLRTLSIVKEAKVLADDKKMETASQGKEVVAENSLEDVEVNDLIETMKRELQQLSDFMGTQKDYEENGRPYAMSFETSPDRQRYAAGGDIDKARSFATPHMNAYLEQAREFEMDPTKPVQQLSDSIRTQKDYEEKRHPYAMSSGISPDRQSYAAGGDIDKVRSFATSRMNAYLEQAKEFEMDPTKPVQQFSDSIRTQKDYEEKRHPYAMSSGTSPDRQSYAARGGLDKVRSFATPRMNAYLEQAKEFDKDPIMPPPSVVYDELKEIIGKPCIPYYIKIAILASKSVGHAVKSSN